MNPLSRLLAGLLAVFALAGAIFFGVFVLALAVAAPGIGNISAEREAEIRKEARWALLGARSSDAMGSRPERRPVGSWVTSRGGVRTQRDYW